MESDATLAALLGTDELTDVPIYEAHQAANLTVTRALVYELRGGYDADLSQEGRRPMELEISAEVKAGTTDAAEILDEIEERLDALLQDWRKVTTNLSVQNCIRVGPAQPTYDASGQGFEGRIWTWNLIVDDI